MYLLWPDVLTLGVPFGEVFDLSQKAGRRQEVGGRIEGKKVGGGWEAMTKLVEFLAKTLMFRGLPGDELAEVAKIAIAQTVPKNDILFWAGDEGKGFFIVKTGKIKVFKLSPEGKEQIFGFFSPGEHFAEVPAFDGGSFPASATAIEPSEVLLFPRQAFLALLQQRPNIAINLLAIFARHLRRFAGLIEDLSLKEVPGRLAAYLLYLSERHQQAERVELDMTKGQLAAFLGTLPETLSRVFAKLSQEGIIALEGSKVELLNRQSLQNLAAGKRLGS